MAENIRVRIAPSPTGHLHVGTARAALFNELFARGRGGKFIIRIEDTDPARSKPEYEKGILAGLRWLGLHWDEGPDIGGPYAPYRQSERQAEHRQALASLLDEDRAYYCDCPPAQDGQPRVECRCREKNLQSGVIKLAIEPQTVTFTDLIRGEVSIETSSFGGDFVIARSLDNPLFHMAVVLDDAAMDISHVIRGEDHIHNTAKHILIQESLGYRRPQYAHLPLLLDEKRQKLSKRSNETSLLAYREMGFLPEAMLNYLSLLGWSPKNDQEIFSHEELINQFSFAGVQKGGAIFSLTKLKNINKYYLSHLTTEDLLARLQSWTEDYGPEDRISFDDQAYWIKAIATEQSRVNDLKTLYDAIGFFRSEWIGDYSADALVWKKSDRETCASLLKKTIEKISSIPGADFTQDFLEQTLLEWIDSEKIGRGDTLWPMRVALTGQEHSPGPFEVAAVLGQEESLRRLRAAYDKIK